MNFPHSHTNKPGHIRQLVLISLIWFILIVAGGNSAVSADIGAPPGGTWDVIAIDRKKPAGIVLPSAFCAVSSQFKVGVAEGLTGYRKAEVGALRNGSQHLLKDGELYAQLVKVSGIDVDVDLQSMTFLSTWSQKGKVTLSQGEYREPAAPGSASEIVVRLSDKKAFGRIERKEAGAVVLVTSTAGTGTFYDLELITKKAKGWVNTDVVLLGDRVKVQAVEIKNDHIVVAMTAHGPGDPMCCPTVEVKKRFTVRGERLVSVDEKTEGGKSQISGTAWQWVQTIYNDDTGVSPDKPENYTITFREDNTLSVKVDCNQKGGAWSASADEKRLSIEITHSTMAACPEGSLEDEFVRTLSSAVSYFIKNGELYIVLKYDTGTMKFTK